MAASLQPSCDLPSASKSLEVYCALMSSVLIADAQIIAFDDEADCRFVTLILLAVIITAVMTWNGHPRARIVLLTALSRHFGAADIASSVRLIVLMTLTVFWSACPIGSFSAHVTNGSERKRNGHESKGYRRPVTPMAS